VFEQNTVNEGTAIVGHSAGAEFALRWLSEHPAVVINRLVLVAPYHDAARKYGDFSEYELDHDLERRVGRMTIFHSTDDDGGIVQRVQTLRSVFPVAHYVEFEGHGHFRYGHNMKYREFPELRDELFAA
jgi:predicted alpha/beta hydrolase family esterase